MDFNLDDRSENQLKWFSHYIQLIERAKERLLEDYSERHHIVPRCMEGTNDKDNLVELTAREHYVAHQLLAKIFPEVNGLVLACHMMCVDKNGNRVSNREYEWIKKEYAKTLSLRLKGETKETSERCQKISQTKTGRRKENYEHLRIIGEKNSKALKGRTKEQYEYLQEISNSFTGQTKENCERVKKTSDSLSGRTKENYEYLREKSDKMKGIANNGVIKSAELRRGQSKETYEPIRKQAETLSKRNRFNDPSMASSARKQRKLSEELQLKIVYLRDEENKKFTEILEILNVDICYSALCNIYKRTKKEIELGGLYK